MEYTSSSVNSFYSVQKKTRSTLVTAKRTQKNGSHYETGGNKRIFTYTLLHFCNKYGKLIPNFKTIGKSG